MRPTPPLEVDELAARWCVALDAGHRAVHAATLYLRPDELRRFDRRLDEDRAAVGALLARVAAERRYPAHLVGWLTSRRHTRTMLSLPEEIEACVFDLDGALTTSATLHAEAWADTLAPLLLERTASPSEFVPFDPRRDYEDHFAGRPRRRGIESFLAARGLTLPEGRVGDLPGIGTVEALSARKNEALRRRLDREGIAAFGASRSYLLAARTLGIRRAVVSPSINTTLLLDRAGLTQLIDESVDGTSIEAGGLAGKPAPDTVLEACRRLAVPPNRTATFETTAVGVQAARAAGVRFVVGVQRHGGLNGCDLSVRDLGALFVLNGG